MVAEEAKEKIKEEGRNMVAWAEYKSNAQKRRALALELFVVVSTPIKPPQEVVKTLPAHLAYQADQEAAGTLAFASPLPALCRTSLARIWRASA